MVVPLSVKPAVVFGHTVAILMQSPPDEAQRREIAQRLNKRDGGPDVFVGKKSPDGDYFDENATPPGYRPHDDDQVVDDFIVASVEYPHKETGEDRAVFLYQTDDEENMFAILRRLSAMDLGKGSYQFTESNFFSEDPNADYADAQAEPQLLFWLRLIFDEVPDEAMNAVNRFMLPD